MPFLTLPALTSAVLLGRLELAGAGCWWAAPLRCQALLSGSLASGTQPFCAGWSGCPAWGWRRGRCGAWVALGHTRTSGGLRGKDEEDSKLQLPRGRGVVSISEPAGGCRPH